MKKRVAAAIVGLLYLSVAVVFGMIHDHHDTSGLHSAHECAACAWHIAIVTDVPMVEVPAVVAQTLTLPVLPAQSVFVPAVFSLASASRAPPAASA